MRKSSTRKITLAAMLIAIGIVIPMFSPVKISIEPASYTLASHVPVMIAMFVSPVVAAAVSLGTTLGFLLAGFPMVVVLRASTHILFAFLGALYLTRHARATASLGKSLMFSFVTALLHAAAEVAVSSVFYFAGATPHVGFVFYVLVLVGVGGVIHSMVDFILALGIVKAVNPAIRAPFLPKA